MSQKHHQDQASFVKKTQREQTNAMVKYADLIGMQLMGDVVFTHNIESSSKKDNKCIYNINIWSMDAHCDTYNLAIEKQAIIIKMYLYIANSLINPNKMLCIYSRQSNIFIEYSKNSDLYLSRLELKSHDCGPYSQPVINLSDTLIKPNIVSKDELQYKINNPNI